LGFNGNIMLKLVGHLITREKHIERKKLQHWPAVLERSQYVVEKKLLTLLGLGGTTILKTGFGLL